MRSLGRTTPVHAQTQSHKCILEHTHTHTRIHSVCKNFHTNMHTHKHAYLDNTIYIKLYVRYGSDMVAGFVKDSVQMRIYSARRHTHTHIKHTHTRRPTYDAGGHAFGRPDTDSSAGSHHTSYAGQHYVSGCFTEFVVVAGDGGGGLFCVQKVRTLDKIILHFGVCSMRPLLLLVLLLMQTTSPAKRRRASAG